MNIASHHSNRAPEALSTSTRLLRIGWVTRPQGTLIFCLWYPVTRITELQKLPEHRMPESQSTRNMQVTRAGALVQNNRLWGLCKIPEHQNPRAAELCKCVSHQSTGPAERAPAPACARAGGTVAPVAARRSSNLFHLSLLGESASSSCCWCTWCWWNRNRTTLWNAC